MSGTTTPFNADTALEEKLLSAKHGREFWLSLEQDGFIRNETFVFLFPVQDSCSICVIRNLEDFIRSLKVKNLLLLFTDSRTECLCREEFSEKEYQESIFYHSITEQEASDIMAYYTLKEFTDRLIIASLSLPRGRHGQDALGVQGITEEEAVRIGILGLAG